MSNIQKFDITIIQKKPEFTTSKPFHFINDTFDFTKKKTFRVPWIIIFFSVFVSTLFNIIRKMNEHKTIVSLTHEFNVNKQDFDDHMGHYFLQTSALKMCRIFIENWFAASKLCKSKYHDLTDDHQFHSHSKIQ